MSRLPHPRGFTILELLISSTIAAVVMTAILSSFVYLGRSLTRLANYQILEAQSRKALTYLHRDLVLAQTVKTGTTPTASSVTLVLPAGEITYTYDAATGRLRRQATFGANTDLSFLKTDTCYCSDFAFDYYTTTLGSAANQLAASQNVPYSIKQIRVRFTLKTPSVYSTATRVSYDTVSSRYVIRNKQPPAGN